VRGLTGSVESEVRQGRVKKFALLGNILSFRGLASLNEMKEDGFPYRRMIAKGRFENGEFLVDESFFDSDAVRLAAHGKVDLLGANSQLTVLVGLLTRVDRIAGAIPLIGDVFGGSMTALPMQVHGDIRNPVIVPLGPRAISSQLLGIFERTLKLPGKLVVPAQEK
jgi:AsmA-like C-terminal region